MLNICICDDSIEFIRVFLNQLKFMCKKHFSKDLNYNLCGAFNTASEVIDYIGHTIIDVLFLDIDMPEMNGFDLAKRVSAINPEIMSLFE